MKSRSSSDTKSEKLFELHNKLQSICGADKIKEIVMAHYLYHLKKDDAWQVASGIENWEDYLRQPEINVSRYKAEKLMRIYKYFVIENGYRYDQLYKVSISALDRIAKLLVSDKNIIDDLLSDAEHLTTRDFKEKIYEVTDGSTKTYTYMIMKRCDQTGNLERVCSFKPEDSEISDLDLTDVIYATLKKRDRPEKDS